VLGDRRARIERVQHDRGETDERTGEHQERRKERDSQRESARLDESDENPVAERDTDERGQKPRQA
jgi:hypothetical protein